MARCNFGEGHTISSSIYVPPRPSCRRPLSRMTERASRNQSPQYARSLKPDRAKIPFPESSESDEILTDEQEEKLVDYESSDDSSPDKHLSFEIRPLRKRCSPSNPFTISQSKCDPNSTKQPATPQQYSRGKSVEKKTANQPSEKFPGWILWLAIGLPVVFCVAYQITLYFQPPVKENLLVESKFIEDVKKFKESIKEMKGTFTAQNHRTWSDIEAGIIDLITGSQKPWTFVLYSNETREISCLAKMLGKASSKALHSEESLELEAKDMGDDYGLAIDRWKPQIDAKKAVVVYDVLEINPGAIQVFHTMCDRENPLVESAVYVLTIITSGNIPQREKPVKFVEDQLTNRFINKVPEDKLQPLITRLTDGPIIPVKPEIGFSGCPL